jgi:hypothetical protein
MGACFALLGASCVSAERVDTAASPLVSAAHLTGEPAGFAEQSSFLVTNNAPTPTSRAFVNGDSLLFRFSDFIDDVTVRVDLYDDQQFVWLATDSTTASAGDGDRFILFSGFPTRADGSVMDSCNYVITLTNNTASNQGTNIQAKVFRHL